MNILWAASSTLAPITPKKNYDIDQFNILSDPNAKVNNHAKDVRHQLDMHLNYAINDKIKVLLGATYEDFDYSLNGRLNGKLFECQRQKRSNIVQKDDISEWFSYI